MNKKFILAKKCMLAGSAGVFALLFFGCAVRETQTETVQEPKEILVEEQDKEGEEEITPSVITPVVTLKKTQVFVTDALEVMPEMFIESIVGTNSYTLGFRNTVLERDEAQVCEAFLEEWNTEENPLRCYEETFVSPETLTEYPILDVDGQYLTELVVADASGGAFVSEVVIFLDATLPVTEKTEQETAAPEMLDRAKAEEVFNLVNAKRTAQGLTALVWDESLYGMACERAQEIVQKFSHERPDGVQIIDALYAAGCTAGCGENIARYGSTASDIVTGWMNSEAHRDNILEPRFTKGTAACFCMEGTYYWVNLFRA